MRRLLRTLLLGAILASPCALATTAPADDTRAIADAVQLIRTEAGTHRLILLGEMHGTREAPKLAASLARAYAPEGPVLLGLELGASLNPALKTYLASDGSAPARAALLAMPAWHVELRHNDGRRNLEVVDLIEQMRLLKAAGRDVAVLAFDVALPGSSDSQARDRVMAAQLRIALEHFPRGRLLSLTGGVHAMRRKPDFAPFLQDPMGSYLVDWRPFSVDITALGGEFWACIDQHCGPVAQRRLFLESARVDSGEYDLRIVLPRFTVARLIDGPTPKPVAAGADVR